VELIDDPADDRLGDYRHLTDADARRAVEGSDENGIFIVEGLLALRQLLVSRFRVRSLVAIPSRTAAVQQELVRLDDHRTTIPFMVASREALADVTGFDVHRGVLASADRGQPIAAEQLLTGTGQVVVTAGINDHENLGSVFRNAAALGLDAVLLDDRAADPLYRRSIRVSAGWALRLPYARMGTAADVPAVLRASGFRSVALTPAPEAVPVDEAAHMGAFDGAVALVLGPEGPGLEPEMIAECDVAVRIPMSRQVDSLNVATSLAVVASFAAARRGWA
jgi:tRNA G18 (ribose-2'-O)-methylase SpoU